MSDPAARHGRHRHVDRSASPADGSSAASSAAEPPGVPRSRRRWLRLSVLGAAAVVAIGLAWLVVTGLLARSQLGAARAELHTLRTQVSAGDLDAARHTAGQISLHASRAHWLTTGPAWSVAAAVPYVGAPAATTRGLTAAVDRLGSQVLPSVVSVSSGLDPATLRAGNGAIRLAPIAAIAPALQRADAVTSAVVADVHRLPSSGWFPPVGSARDSALSQLTGLGGTLHTADLAARLVPAMLGQHGTRRYFVAIQNEAEARGTGGLPGAFAIVSATDGTLHIDRIDADTTLFGTQVDLDFGPDYRQLYNGADTMTQYGNSNLSPNFPYAAQIWLAMWQKFSGQRLDGAIAVDPTAMSYLLAVTGPARMSDGTEVGASNVVALTQSTVYAKFPGTSSPQVAARRDYQVALARAVSAKLLAPGTDTRALITAAAKAAGQRRLLVYSADPATQRLIAQTSLSGIVPRTSRPYVGAFIVNDGGNKLDYYLDRSVVWTRTGCGPTRTVTVTITLTNNAPGSGLSTYVTARSDKHSYPVEPGDNRLLVNYLATAGAEMDSVDVDGRPSTASDGTQSGHPMYTVDLELPHGRTRTVVFHLTEPAAAGGPIVLRQPLVRPLAVTLHDRSCR